MAINIQGDSEPKGQAMHRLRIGIAGLVIVTVLTGGASMLVHRAGNEEPVETAISDGGTATEPNPVEQADGNTEPLAELGVVPDLPASEEEQEASKEEAAPSGQLVPDLKPKSDIANDPQ